MFVFHIHGSLQKPGNTPGLWGVFNKLLGIYILLIPHSTNFLRCLSISNLNQISVFCKGPDGKQHQVGGHVISAMCLCNILETRQCGWALTKLCEHYNLNFVKCSYVTKHYSFYYFLTAMKKCISHFLCWGHRQTDSKLHWAYMALVTDPCFKCTQFFASRGSMSTNYSQWFFSKNYFCN